MGPEGASRKCYLQINTLVPNSGATQGSSSVEIAELLKESADATMGLEDISEKINIPAADDLQVTIPPVKRQKKVAARMSSMSDVATGLLS